MSDELARELSAESAPANEEPASESAESAPAPASESEASAPSEPELSQKAKDRIQGALADKHKYKGEAERLRQENERLKAAQTAEVQDVPPPATMEDCGWDEAEFKRRDAERTNVIRQNAKVEGLNEAKMKAQEEAAIRAGQQRVATFSAKIDERAKENPGIVQAVDIAANTLFNESARLAIVEDDNAAAIVEHLTADLSRMDDLNAMSPARAAAEIGRLSERLSSQPKPEPKLTSAPEPPTEVKGGGALPDGHSPRIQGYKFE